MSSYPAETEEEPEYEIVDTVETEEEEVKKLQESVKKVQDQKDNPSTPQTIQQVKVIESPHADDGSALLRMLSPKTGDEANILFWILLMSCSLAGIAGGLIWNRKKKNKRKNS